MNKINYGIAKTGKDFEGILKLVKEVFDDDTKKLAKDLMFNSPKKDRNIFFYAYDQIKEKYVGTICLIDVSVKFSGVKVKAAEYGIAATDKRYRGLGINQRLSEMFFDECVKGDYSITLLEGIPNFYRKYGFNYAVPMENESLNLSDIETNHYENIKIRKANKEDINLINKEHIKATDKLGFCKYKEKEIIDAQMHSYTSKVTTKEYYILEEDNNIKGYFTLNDDNGIKVTDISYNLPFKFYEKVLSFLKKEKSMKQLSANIPNNTKFTKFLRIKGSKREGQYAWQLRIIDDYKFLKDIKSILESRLNKSIYKDEEIEFYYNNFKYLVKVAINNGKIHLEKQKRKGCFDFNLTSQGATKLFFGDKNMDEIKSFLPDCHVDQKYKNIVYILFPKLLTHFYNNY
ncbi:GNAT family N-acetyltransferase [Dethiothermospora halolimnae]|uniref:GNAT family N-acetyltransferase n=1 Tax=Dethiothermospora halolimnae TaxID=3114390 RepID=UPI003CCB8E48